MELARGRNLSAQCARRETHPRSKGPALRHAAGRNNCRLPRELENNSLRANTIFRRVRLPRTAARQARNAWGAHQRDALHNIRREFLSSHHLAHSVTRNGYRRNIPLSPGNCSALAESLHSALYAAPQSTTIAVRYIHKSKPIAAARPP